MTTPLDSLQQDRVILTQILHSRRSVSVETMEMNERIAWQMYLALLADALNTLDSLIDHLKQNTNGDDQISS